MRTCCNQREEEDFGPYVVYDSCLKLLNAENRPLEEWVCCDHDGKVLILRKRGQVCSGVLVYVESKLSSELQRWEARKKREDLAVGQTRET